MTNNITLVQDQSNNTVQNQVQFDLSIFEVVGDKVNLTKMAKSQNKSITRWLANPSTKKYLEVLESAYGFSVITQNIGNNGSEQGTFGTREVALKLAQWLSPEFEVFCIKQLDTLFQTGKVELPKPENKMDLILQFQDALNLAVSELKVKDYQLQLQAPKVELADNYLVKGANMNLSTTAKALNIKVIKFTQALYDKHLIFDSRGNKVPYSPYEDWFCSMPFVAPNGHKGLQLLVTPIGFEKLSKLLEPKNIIQKAKKAFEVMIG